MALDMARKYILPVSCATGWSALSGPAMLQDESLEG